MQNLEGKQMIEKISTNARINPRDEAHLSLFYLIKILFNKVNEIIDVVNKLEVKNK
jgi:hypothetical protein